MIQPRELERLREIVSVKGWEARHLRAWVIASARRRQRGKRPSKAWHVHFEPWALEPNGMAWRLAKQLTYPEAGPEAEIYFKALEDIGIIGRRRTWEACRLERLER